MASSRDGCSPAAAGTYTKYSQIMPKKYNMPEVKFLSIILTPGHRALNHPKHTKIPAGENNAVSLYRILINLHIQGTDAYLFCWRQSFMSLWLHAHKLN